MEIKGLLLAEARLTASILAGALAGEALVRLRITDAVFRPIRNLLSKCRINRHALSAMAVSVASPRLGAAILSSAHREGRITRDDAVFGTLCLAFPAYIKRWLATAPVAVGLAGNLGLLYSIVLITRSACRFILCLLLLLRRGSGEPIAFGLPQDSCHGANCEGHPHGKEVSLIRLTLRSLPMAWGFFALTFFLMPHLEAAVLGTLKGKVSPSALAVVTSALMHSSASLASAQGALSSGALSLKGALLALLAGNCIGTFSRVLRQNMGYWVGIFPPEVLRPLAIWHVGTLLLFEALSMALVGLWWYR
ncbi:hypothetical protein TheveDRAFT_0065 [Thermanaerovibrio velox DSM 12556]|uniref:Nucleoside recognition protein n=1 Tax=Thermanaerovibrio velox DSM 12556 TaxID=926567 RepID=H0UMV9_9BACT|nr:hypothetical protein [Thermanaerovibrio velox]EHM09254.1 hypothetical protein TheveDRAFT_0065 [Thermanaerovibrio velox DSM 12556]